ncbi:MAG TPA: flagellar basal body rod protein FlgB [Rhizobiaceae bacterium]|jgi:flagellar basal-body rod protein FlgB|nr:flagellar basal body rod protein FlgB [Rhizobiaceae bacterium]
MQPVNLFNLAAQQARWLSVRQSVIAGNVANVNTPGYVARDVEPFEAVLDDRHVSMKTTEPGHMSGNNPLVQDVSLREDDENPTILPSGNTVSLQTELVKSADVQRQFNINTAIVKAFHNMMSMATKE